MNDLRVLRFLKIVPAHTTQHHQQASASEAETRRKYGHVQSGTAWITIDFVAGGLAAVIASVVIRLSTPCLDPALRRFPGDPVVTDVVLEILLIRNGGSRVSS